MSSILPDPGDYTIKRAAAETGISAKTIRRQVLAGEIPARQVETVFGMTYVLDRDVVDRLKTAKRTVSNIVAVKRPADSTSMALVVAKALEDALNKRDDALTQKVDELTTKIIELTEEIARDRQRSWWQRLTGR